ncbi:ATP synthase subunit I [Alishewanella sp. SMS9]|uniref:ATP synthase subunit I n=1 Tax=Pseudoalteromonas tunicata TaxID=314281 RepID=UPI00273E2376|nr:ATP synthase subunit I [Pseudoalteromonas tunicata]MDP5205516.1 ATP synthase subunit I [Alishewanella sp. SMS9]MDP5215309.1 ATP synthase subunit I [Pseudoalteromonas tunicata]
MPINILEAIGALLSGAVLGMFYFTGLWWTVHRLGATHFVSPIFIISLVVRTLIVMAGFYLILGDHWLRLGLALIGFIVVRIVATKLIGQTAESTFFKLE